MTITNWPLAERPREKLLALGEKYVTDAELIAIFLRTGTHEKTALDIARELLSEIGGLKKIVSADSKHFYQKSGIGKAKYAMLRAAVELGRRAFAEEITPGEIIRDSQTTKRFLADRLKHYPHEVFACLFLDSHHQLIQFEELFHGTLNEASVYPREVVKRGLAHNAAKMILAHNHPSGNPQPSQADKELTRLLKEALALVDIKLIDHIIVGKKTISLAELGWL